MCDESRNEAPFTEEQNQQLIDTGIIAGECSPQYTLPVDNWSDRGALYPAAHEQDHEV